ncbi:MAG: aminoglycoside phosphotransferase family protein [Frankiaceae bacterium]
MSHATYRIPDIVAAKATAAGDDGIRWLQAIDDTVSDLAAQWSITIGRQLSGGTTALVVRATLASGEPAVLKLAVPGSSFAAQARTLVAAEGRGYVRALAHDAARDAVLLEGLGERLDRSGRPAEAQLTTLGRLLRVAWEVPRPDEAPHDKASSLAELVRELAGSLGPACPTHVIERALRCAAGRAAAFLPERCVTVHGDAAAANVLAVPHPREGAVDGYVFVDPDGFVGDPEYDLGVAVRDWGPELLAAPDPRPMLRGWCDLLAAETGADPAAVWEWGYLERVSTGLYLLSLGAKEWAAPFLTTAAALAAG